MQTPKLLDPRLPSISPDVAQIAPPERWSTVADEVAQHSGWNVLSLQQRDSTLTLVAESDGSLFAQEQVDRVTAVLHRSAPASATHFVIQLQQVGLGLARIDLDRAEWVAQRTQAQPPSLRLAAQQTTPTLAMHTPTAAVETGDYRQPHINAELPEFVPARYNLDQAAQVAGLAVVYEVRINSKKDELKLRAAAEERGRRDRELAEVREAIKELFSGLQNLEERVAAAERAKARSAWWPRAARLDYEATQSPSPCLADAERAVGKLLYHLQS
jgi:hypothetical protein